MLRFGTDGVRGLANAELTPGAGHGSRPGCGPGPRRACRRGPAPVHCRPGHPLVGASAAGRPVGRAWRPKASTWSTSASCPRRRSPSSRPSRVRRRRSSPRRTTRTGTTASSSSPPEAPSSRTTSRTPSRLSSSPPLAWTTHRTPGSTHPSGRRGASSPDLGALARYERHVLELPRGTAPATACGWRSTAPTAPLSSAPRQVFASAGAEMVAVLAAEPDGTNINDGLRLHRPPPAWPRRSWTSGPTSGLAFDGDADRVIAVDASRQRGRRRPPARPVRHRPGPAGPAGRAGPSWSR